MSTVHPEYLGVWCPTCRQDALPMRNRTCGFCDTPIINDQGLPIRERGKGGPPRVTVVPHGSKTGYRWHSCRCDPCKRAQRDALRAHRKAAV